MTSGETDFPPEGNGPLSPARPGGEGAPRPGEVEGTRRVLKVGPAQEEWVVTWVGSALAAVPHSSSVALVELEAVPAEQPEREVRRLLLVGRSLGDIPDEEIVARLDAKGGRRGKDRPRREGRRASR